MPKYEIMLILDPKATIEVVETLATDVFGKDVAIIKKLDRTQLAYPIKNLTTALYVIVTVDAISTAEFTRKANLHSSIFRYLAINLDSERKHKIKKHFKFVNKRDERKKPYGDRARKTETTSFKETPK